MVAIATNGTVDLDIEGVNGNSERFCLVNSVFSAW